MRKMEKLGFIAIENVVAAGKTTDNQGREITGSFKEL